MMVLRKGVEDWNPWKSASGVGVAQCVIGRSSWLAHLVQGAIAIRDLWPRHGLVFMKCGDEGGNPGRPKYCAATLSSAS